MSEHTYTNPRKSAVINDWPSGSKRVTATFSVESHPKRGERAVRQTTGNPKKLTYAKSVVFADGDDGRIYVLELSQYGMISVMKGTFDYNEETVHDSNPRYSALRALFDQVPSAAEVTV